MHLIFYPGNLKFILLATEQLNKDQKEIGTDIEDKAAGLNDTFLKVGKDLNGKNNGESEQFNKAKKTPVQKKKNIEKPVAEKNIKKKKNAAIKKSSGSKTAVTSPTEKEKKQTSTSKKTKAAVKKSRSIGVTKIIFQIKFHTKPGESLFIVGDHPLFGNGDLANALPMQ